MDDDGREELGDTTCDYGGWWKGWAKRVWMQTFHSFVPFLQISTCFVFGLLVTFDKKKTFLTIWWNVIIFSYLTDWKRVVSLFFQRRRREKKISDALVCERADEENIT